MADDIPESNRLQIPDASNVIIIGVGPVGLLASLLLSHYQVPHVLVEQLPTPDNNPQAHFLNCRSMEILRELDMLNQAVYARSAPADEWRRFVYCTGLADLPSVDHIQPAPTGSMLGMVDHFADARNAEFSPERVAHFPQHDFVRLLRGAALKSYFCYAVEGYHASIQEYHSKVTVTLTNRRTGRRQQIETQYVVAADGAHSSTRKQLNIKLINKTNILQNLINAHFFSPKLAERLRSGIPAMLYFIYSSSGVAVLVAHALDRGEFVAQVPYFPPYQQIDDFDRNTCIELLQKLVGQPIDIDVRSIRKWRMGIRLASRFRSRQGRCFLVGDAAHQFTPAGGFGMNTGIQDAHNLIWKLVLALRFEDCMQLESAERLLSSYEQERKPVAHRNAKISKAGNLNPDFHEFKTITRQSIVDVCVSHNQRHDRYHFSYDMDGPAFLPRTYAILIRPDGHIAWFKAKVPNRHGSVKDFRATNAQG